MNGTRESCINSHLPAHIDLLRSISYHYSIFQKRVALENPKSVYLRHKVGVNNTKMVKTSRRPSSMAAEHTQVWKSLKTP